MAQYSRSLDLVTSSLRLAQKGKMKEAAKLFEAALKSKDLETTLAAIETQQVAAFEEVQAKNPTLASLFTEIAAKKAPKKKSKAKAKPFGGKKAPPFGKKKVKASEDGEGEGEDDEESAVDDIAPVLDEMTADEGMDVTDGEDLSLEDLDGLLEDDGVEEMPEATAAEGEDDAEEESSEDSEEESSEDEDSEEESSEDKEGEEESAPAQTAKTKAPTKVKVIAGNLAALDRLRKSKAGASKPAK